MGSASMRARIACAVSAKRRASSGAIAAIAAMSAPATNAFSPAPVRTSAFTPRSVSARATTSPSSAIVFASSAFSTLGRLNVRTPTPSSTSNRMFS